MYPHFIEVHSPFTDERMMMNIETIRLITVDKGVTNIYQNGISVEDVKESYDEVKKLIEDSGCLIQMGDPRLDNHPLTIDQLKDMIGEPVWDSNKQAWGLVCDQFDGLVRIRGYKSASYDYNADDLIRFPVYQMKA